MNREKQREREQRLLDYVRGALLQKGHTLTSFGKEHNVGISMVRMVIVGRSHSQRIESALRDLLGYVPAELDVDTLPSRPAADPDEAA